MREYLTKDITLIGKSDDIESFKDLCAKFKNFDGWNEASARLTIMFMLDESVFKSNRLEVMYSGNYVWSKKRLLADLNKVITRNSMNVLPNYLYKFLTLCCGSIAHNNKFGWIATYPTVNDLRRFFMTNEFGERVKWYIPKWKTDAIVIVEEMEKILGLAFRK